MSTDLERMTPLIGPWLSRQRWAARGEADLTSVEVVDSERMEAAPALWWLLVRAGGDVYQVLLGEEPAADAADRGEAAVLGTVEGPGGPWVVFDAVSDPALVRLLAARIGVTGVEDALVRPVGAEQSNTSMVIDERIILKFFRRLQAGVNPDVEVTTGLDEVGFNHLASPVAQWRRGDYDLAVAQEFLAGGSEGWALAITSLRDLYAGDEEDPAAAGGDFSAESRRIGEMTARLHLALDRAFGRFPAEVDGWVAEMRERAGRLGLGGRLGDAVDQVSSALGDLADPGPSTRVHGDYHLGQVMRTDAGWFVLDFEGEPARPLEERRKPSSPLKDVAGMLRSFDYAAAVALGERSEAEREGRQARGRAWEERTRRSFLDGYLGTDGIEALLPPGGGFAAVLAFFELDKALYELGYERAHRPDWVSIPERAIERLREGYEHRDDSSHADDHAG